MIFDLARIEALENLKEWYNLLVKNAGHIPLDLIGAKSDLITENLDMTINSDYIHQWQKELGGSHYLETSAKRGINTSSLFSQLVQQLVDQTYPEE